MMNIADIGRKHLADQLTGAMHHLTVSEWIDPETGQPIELYWKPLTGVEQRQIDACSNQVDRIAMTVKVRARDASGRLVFADTGLTSLVNDFDFDVLRAIAYIISGDLGQDAEADQEAAEKE